MGFGACTNPGPQVPCRVGQGRAPSQIGFASLSRFSKNWRRSFGRRARASAQNTKLDWLGRQAGMLEMFFSVWFLLASCGWSWRLAILSLSLLSSSAWADFCVRAVLHEVLRWQLVVFSAISLSFSRAFSSTLRRVVMQMLSTSVLGYKMGVRRYRMPGSIGPACSRWSSSSSGVFGR